MKQAFWSLVVLAVSGCGFPGIPTFANKASFEEFELTRSPGLGFCIDTEMVLSAVIRRSESGAQIVSMQVIVNELEMPTETGECREGLIFMAGGCAEIVEVQPRELTQDELDELETAFTWMGVRVAALPFFSYDPCLVTTYRWDGFEAKSCPCGNFLGEQDQEQIENVLLSLVQN